MDTHGAPVLGLPKGVVLVVDYDPRWPDLARSEIARIDAACAGLELRVEHVGSTAVPGLCAKPVLDLLAGRPKDVALAEVLRALTAAGYEYRGDLGLAGREYLRRGDPAGYHLHLVEQGSDHWNRMIAFRDYLRGHPDRAEEYGRLKRTWATMFSDDREAYVAAKSPFIERVTRLALGLDEA